MLKQEMLLFLVRVSTDTVLKTINYSAQFSQTSPTPKTLPLSLVFLQLPQFTFHFRIKLK